MNIYIYSDESGVFDCIHNDFYIYGGIIFLDKNDRDIANRKYLNVESVIRKCNKDLTFGELKASRLNNKQKYKIYRSLNNYYKFGVVIDQKQVHKNIFNDKKTKQRYLDYAYKIGVKSALTELINEGIIVPDIVENICFFVDEHTTATNGRYELSEALRQELKIGTYNFEYGIYYEPLFPKVNRVELQYCNSAKKPLIRAADIIANRIYYLANCSVNGVVPNNKNLFMSYQPIKKF